MRSPATALVARVGYVLSGGRGGGGGGAVTLRLRERDIGWKAAEEVEEEEGAKRRRGKLLKW